LHGGYLCRIPQVANIEDANTTETLGTDRLLDSLYAAVEPGPGVLYGHEKKVASD